MITLKQWMETVDYRITEGSNYQWTCYGPNAYMLDSWNGVHDGHSIGIVFDTETQVVYEVSAYDYQAQRAYRMINPEFQKAHTGEVDAQGLEDCAWDDVKYIDLDVLDDFVEKAQAIVKGEEYDTRVQIELTFGDDELLAYMQMAHKLDITFNQLVTRVLEDEIARHENHTDSL